jgi:hypothetical protein
MVRFLEQELSKEKLGKLEKTRVMNLPSLLQRSGLLQVGVFLEAKEDKVLQELLENTVREVLGDNKFQLAARYLADCNLGQTLLLEELALEAAVWIRRLFEAKTIRKQSMNPAASDEAS